MDTLGTMDSLHKDIGLLVEFRRVGSGWRYHPQQKSWTPSTQARATQVETNCNQPKLNLNLIWLKSD